VLVGAYAIGFSGASSARGTSFVDGAFFLVAWALPVLLVWLAAFLAEELLRPGRSLRHRVFRSLQRPRDQLRRRGVLPRRLGA
ncbi:hypothetical protein CNY89_28955, partial [Amaricoccus sp. HAR-UPW-R2A-40]